MGILTGITVLLIYQLVGETLVLVLELPVPGPVVGMVLLFFTLVARGTIPESVDSAAAAILKHLSLLFVPAGVGVMVHFQRIGSEWLPISLALVGSTLLSLAITALTMGGVRRLMDRRAGPHEG
jgi:holin-like protein